MCGVVQTQLNPGTDCEAALTARSGCGADEFGFSSPTRAQVLACRVPLVRKSDSAEVAPGCDNVGEALSNCPDLVRFFGGTP